MDAQVSAGIAQWFWSNDGSTGWFVRRCTKLVADVHLFSMSGNLVRNCREIQAMIWTQTDYKKLEMRTHLAGVAVLAKRIGWSHEGTRRSSFELEDGKIADEYLYGVVKNG